MSTKNSIYSILLVFYLVAIVVGFYFYRIHTDSQLSNNPTPQNDVKNINTGTTSSNLHKQDSNSNDYKYEDIEMLYQYTYVLMANWEFTYETKDLEQSLNDPVGTDNQELMRYFLKNRVAMHTESKLEVTNNCNDVVSRTDPAVREKIFKLATSQLFNCDQISDFLDNTDSDNPNLKINGTEINVYLESIGIKSDVKDSQIFSRVGQSMDESIQDPIYKWIKSSEDFVMITRQVPLKGLTVEHLRLLKNFQNNLEQAKLTVQNIKSDNVPDIRLRSLILKSIDYQEQSIREIEEARSSHDELKYYHAATISEKGSILMATLIWGEFMSGYQP